MSSAPRSVPLLLISAFVLTTAAIAAPVPTVAGVAGRVVGDSSPLASAKVYAYELADLSLRKAVTDREGRFRFDHLPAGLYKIIAIKGGFSPAIVLLTRAAAEATQFVEVELTLARGANDSTADNFWKLRSEVPPDVLRDLRSAAATQGGNATEAAPSLASLAGQVQVINGSDQGLDFGNALVQGGKVGVEGQVHDLKVGLQGHFLRLASAPAGFSGVGGDPAARSGAAQAVKVKLESGNSDQIKVTGLSDRLGPASDRSAIGFEHYGVDWSRTIGDGGQSNLSAQYTSEQNFYRQGSWGPVGIPDSSRSWRIAGSYTNSLSDITTVQAGFRFRSRQGDGFASAASTGPITTGQRLDLFGRGGYRVQPAMLVEYGLFSTLADGSVSLTPRGGVVLQLGDHWKAATSASLRVSASGALNRGDFFTAFYNELNNCGEAETYCYKVMLSRAWGHGEQVSLAALDRKFADTLRLYFSQNFFDRLESLYVVRGDNLPELKFSFTSRIAPSVLAKFESNVAAGGGGVFYSGDQQAYENQIRYLVTSIDTHFEKTSTGVFIAFHRLEQGLSPAWDHAAPGTEQTDLERVQVVLTQGLDALLDVASRWAVEFNLELSRGTAPGVPNTTLAARDDIRRKLTGGLTVSF
ncbi:MAG TPA: carboxypeptidase-like regulatory domain-containing protein [Thermoanaerobaculia bacterium]|nr:carboxypeptidase-like regulatory domain-containing protein [Thermoanaerobaculia bacterium]